MKTSKRLLSLLLALALAVSLLPELPVFAGGEDLSLTIAGVKVTRENCEDVLGDGMFAYDYEERTLYLFGGSLEYAGDDESRSLLESRVNGLTIRVMAATWLDAVNAEAGAFILNESTRITGAGDLYLSGGITIGGGTLAMSKCFVNITRGPIYGSSKSCRLVIDDGTLFCGGSIYSLGGGIGIENARLVQPADATVSSEGVKDTEGNYVNNVLIQGDSALYQLQVAGVRVYDWNKDDVLEDGGNFVYEPSTKTLYTGGGLSYGGGLPVIYSGEDGLTIHPLRKTTLSQKREGQAVLGFNGNATILGPAGLGLFGMGGCGIQLHNGSDLTISTTSVYIDAAYGLAGSGGSALALIGCDLEIESTYGAIDGIPGGFSDRSADLTAPEDAEYRDGAFRRKESNELVEQLRFENSEENMKLEIDGVPVTMANCDDVLNNGVFTFELGVWGEESALHVKGGFTCLGPMIENRIPGLIVKVDKQSQLVSRRDAVLQTWESLSVEGSYGLSCYGGFDLHKTDMASVYVFSDAPDTELSISVPSFNVWGIRGQSDSEENRPMLTVDDCNLSSMQDLAIAGFSDVALISCMLEYGNVVNGTVVDAEGGPAEQVRIVRDGSGSAVTYELWICGEQVTEENRTDILGDGVFSFEPEYDMLFLRGDCTAEDVDIIHNKIDGLQLDVNFDSQLTASKCSAIWTEGDLTITGNSNRLTILSPESGAIYLSGSFDERTHLTLRLEDLTLSIQSCIYGITGNSGNERLVVRNSSVRIEDAIAGAVSNLGAGVVLMNCTLTSPPDGSLEENGILNGEGDPAQTVVIQDAEQGYDLWICGIQVNSENASDVLGDGGFYYDTDNARLTIDGTRDGAWTCETGPCILSGVCKLDIMIRGPVLLSSHNDDVIVLKDDTAIWGDTYWENEVRAPTDGGEADVLTLRGGAGGIRCLGSGVDLDLTGLSVTCDTQDFGIVGAQELDVHRIEYSGPAIFDCAYIDLSWDTVTVPAGGRVENPYHNSERHVSSSGLRTPEEKARIVDKDGVIADRVALSVNPFVDVAVGKFYYEPVLWALYYEPRVTTGTDATHFSPSANCTRAQVVTFLWRAAGCPSPKPEGDQKKGPDCPFTDVKKGAFYFDAMLWAVSEGVTTGLTATTFGPNAPCTRGQVVTFLWRAAGEPQPKNTKIPFTDVKKKDFYSTAVLWAVETGVTNGLSATRFGPKQVCTRGQVVAFLQRAISVGPKG